MLAPDDLRIFIVIIPIVLMIMGINKPQYAAIGYMFFVYCKTSSYYPVFATINAELLFAILIFARIFISTDSFRKLSFKYNPVNKYLFILTCCIFLSFGLAWDAQYSWDNAVYHYIKVLILYIMIVSTLDDLASLKMFAWSFIGMFAYLAYEPVYGYLTGTGGSEQIYGINYIAQVGILAGHVALANNMNQMIPLAYYLFFSIKKRIFQILALVPLLIFIVALIGSGSRGGVVGFFIFGIFLVLFSKQRLKMAVLAGICLIIIFLGTELSTTASRIGPEAASGRFTGLTHGIGMIQKGNIFGVGPGCYLFARGRYFSYTMESHNIYGEVLGELGIPGTIAWVFFMYHIFMNIRKSMSALRSAMMEQHFLYKLAMALQVSLAVRLAISMASHGVYYFYWYVLAALSIALVKVTEDVIVQSRNEDSTLEYS